MSNKSSLRWKELPDNLKARIIGDKLVLPAKGIVSNEVVKPSKYRNEKCEYKGIRFDSKKERQYYVDLLTLQQAGEVTLIELQVCFPYRVKYYIAPLTNSFEKDYKYIADFRVTYADRIEYVDVKGFKTAIYKRKKKIVEKLYGIEIIEK
jgi:hypothetical protein